MSRAAFTIVYDGPSLADHTMDVRDLAPALLAVGALCDAANAALNGERSKITVNVKATEPGCFSILLEIAQHGFDHFIALLSSSEASAAANLKTLLFGAGLPVGVPSLLWLIKKLRGRVPDKVTHLKDGVVRITYGDTTIEIPQEILRLYQDVAVRAAAQKVVEEPLKKDGIHSFKVFDPEQPVATEVFEIRKEESHYFAKPSIADDVLVDEVRRSVFSIISLAFKEDNKWRLNDGTNAISVLIEDKDFLDRVDNNQISFAKNDILICDVRVLQKQTESGLKTEYTVIRVVEHRTAARQLPLPFDPSRP